MWGDPIFLRAVERILAVAIGGVAIWCGYRLFLAVPNQRADGTAELALSKDRRLLVTRIGPGTFFALFGTAVVVASYAFPVAVTGGGVQYSGAGPEAGPTPAGATAALPLPPPPLSDEEMRQSLAFLDDMEAQLAATGGEDDRDWRARRFRAAKLAIMERAWRPEWGDPAEFELWLNETPPRTPRPEFERALAVLEDRG